MHKNVKCELCKENVRVAKIYYLASKLYLCYIKRGNSYFFMGFLDDVEFFLFLVSWLRYCYHVILTPFALK